VGILPAGPKRLRLRPAFGHEQVLHDVRDETAFVLARAIGGEPARPLDVGIEHLLRRGR
jgi:hypothetical protein